MNIPILLWVIYLYKDAGSVFFFFPLCIIHKYPLKNVIVSIVVVLASHVYIAHCLC